MINGLWNFIPGALKKTNSMQISIVIPTYNRPGLAMNLAKEIRRYEPKAEIIVVDQSTVKEDPKKIETLFVKYIDDNKVNTSTAKNVGLAKATGDIVFFFDDDIEITPQTINAHLNEYEDPEVMGIAGRVINDGEEVPRTTDVETGKTNRFLTAFISNFWGTKRQLVQFPYGCNMSFRRSILKKLGGFDEKITPPGFEEYDLGLSVTMKGKMIFSPEALVYHHRATTGGNRLKKTDWFKKYYWNYGRMIAKHVSLPGSIYSLVRIAGRILKEYPPAIGSFFTGYFQSISA
ncbi:TPA: hypothetical protein DD455_04600 [Candidatus Shapirobacteria bacterium]|nr:hypothetical protein [Candidatus Shapirobacteria bacterium]